MASQLCETNKVGFDRPILPVFYFGMFDLVQGWPKGKKQSSLFCGIYLWDKLESKFSFSLLFHIEITNDGKNNGSDHVYKQILHGVMKANIQIAAQAKRLLAAVGMNDDYVGDIPDQNGNIILRIIQRNGIEFVNHRILLHIQHQDSVHCVLIKFP